MSLDLIIKQPKVKVINSCYKYINISLFSKIGPIFEAKEKPHQTRESVQQKIQL